MCSGLDAIQVVIYKDNWTASNIHVMYPPVAVIGNADWMNVLYTTRVRTHADGSVIVIKKKQEPGG